MDNINKRKYPITIRIEDENHGLEIFRHKRGYSFTLVVKTPFFSREESVMLRNNKEREAECDSLRSDITDYARKHEKAKGECSKSISVKIPEESGLGFEEFTANSSSFEQEFGPLIDFERRMCEFDPKEEGCDRIQRVKVKKIKALFKLAEICKSIPKEGIVSEELQGEIFKLSLLIDYPDYFDENGHPTYVGKVKFSAATSELQSKIDAYPIKKLSHDNNRA